MSRTREGMDPEPNQEPQDETIQPTGQRQGSQIDERLGARGQTDYSPGRESRRDFPRRSTSFRGRSETQSQQRQSQQRESQQRGSYSQPQQRQAYGRYSGYDYENRGETRSRYRTTSPYGRREETSEDFGGQSQERGIYDRNPGYGSRGYGARGYESRGRAGGYGYEGYGRSGSREFEDEGRSSRRISSGQAYDYDREDTGYRSQREEYDEPYERETFSGRSGNYGRSYEPRRYEAGLEADRDEYDSEYEGRDWDDRRYGRRFLRCADIMTKDVTICSPQTVIRDVADKLEDDGVGSLPVVENHRLVGIITDRDIVCRVLAEGRDSRTTMAADAMSDDVVTCTPDESVVEAIHKMGEHQIRRIPVCDMNGRLRGIIAMADVALEAENDQEIANALEQISRPTPNRARRV